MVYFNVFASFNSSPFAISLLRVLKRLNSDLHRPSPTQKKSGPNGYLRIWEPQMFVETFLGICRKLQIFTGLALRIDMA